MHFSNIFKHSDKTAPATAQDEAHKEHGKHHHEKRFANDAMRTSNTPDTLYGFDDPTARRLGPVPSSDPTNTGA
ncbi:hypothetical protein MUCCIDRAFT_108445 [Mucor lusitanicus CBS 277.49]|uniref:Uncharacterized protein n=1 Tax=Mucor lusitanicus CBS 277.49 TaxID=747725 RepID=A0A162MRJ8_MUCCL|nr:hypothetical protein MUCCIDRAFT_108445 [Mucor lusitanicus CBS 277.49]